MRSFWLACLLLSCAISACSSTPAGQCSPEERCGDGIDNDCDGKIDEGCDCAPQSVQDCGVGECAGQQQCNSGTWGPCYGKDPQPEICDGKDNDCDGVIDNGDNACGGACDLPDEVGAPCDGPDGDLCKEGVFGCADLNSLSCSDMTGTLVEICGNGIDDNCDGRIDEYCGERTLVWSDNSGSTVVAAQAQAQAVAVAASGEIYVGGSHTHDITFGGTTPVDAGTSPDAFVLAYSAAGHLDWHVDIGGVGDATVQAIAVDPADGSLVIVGNFGGFQSGAVAFDGTTTKTPIADNDGFVARYTSAGALVRVATFGSDQDDQIFGVAIDATGHVGITGRFSGTSLALGSITVPRSGFSNTYFTAYLDSSFTPIWARRIEFTSGFAGDIAGRGIAFDGSGNLFVGGTAACFTNCLGPTPTLSVNIGQSDAVTILAGEFPSAGFVASYNTTGGLRWAASTPPAFAVAVEGAAVYATGQFGGEAQFALGTPQSTTILAVGPYDGWLGKYALDGTFAWVRQLGGSGSCIIGLSAAPNDTSNALAVSNGPVLAGAYQTTATVASDLSLPGDGFGNVFWAGYDPTGAVTYAHEGKVGTPQCNGGGGGYGVAVAPSGNVVVVGGFTDHLILPTTTLTASTNENEFFVAVFSP